MPTASVEGGTGDSLAEAGQVLHHLGDERESARGALGGVLLHQVEERRGHDGRAHEAKEQGGADQAVGQVLPAALGTAGSPRGEDFLQLPRKYAGGGKEGKKNQSGAQRGETFKVKSRKTTRMRNVSVMQCNE